jgi:hypothetical protein
MEMNGRTNKCQEKRYHITARFVNDEMIFVDFDVVGVPEFPVFFPEKGVSRLLFWRE